MTWKTETVNPWGVVYAIDPVKHQVRTAREHKSTDGSDVSIP